MKKCAACKLLKDEENFGVNNQAKDRLGWSCKECEAKRAAGLRKSQPAKFKLRDRKNNARRKYGISLEEYNRLAARENCDICGLKLIMGGPKRTLPSVDHDHKTGKIRGVLCGNCNVALGLFGDSPETLEKAARYLRV